MTSVRSLVSQKIIQRLDALKNEIIVRPAKASRSHYFMTYCKTISQNVVSSKIELCPDLSSLKAMQPNVFYHGKDGLLLLRPRNSDLVWIFSHEVFNSILNQLDGLGKTGEVYLVGSDYKFKSTSRLVNDRNEVILQNQSVLNGLKGLKGTSLVEDYRSVSVISSYSPIKYDRLFFVILSEIDQQEIIQPLNKTFYNLLILAILLGLLTLALAILSTKKVLKQTTLMNEEINSLHSMNEENQKKAAIRVIKIQEDEREKIAYNLHDSVGQYLTALKWRLSHLTLEIKDNTVKDKIKELGQICENIIQEIQSISRDIMPSLIKDFGCFKAIEEYLEHQKSIYNIQVLYQLSANLETYRFKKDFQINLFRMIQEMFQNTIKHASADSISIQFDVQEGFLSLQYKDNGIGLAHSEPFPKSISYRAQLFNGSMLRPNTSKGLYFQINFNLKDVLNGPI